MKGFLEERGYDVQVGKMKMSASTILAEVNGELVENAEVKFNVSEIPSSAKYVIKVKESAPSFSPVWCVFNGFWWWRFNMSIMDNKTGEELFAWTGRGCAESSMTRFERALDKLEK